MKQSKKILEIIRKLGDSSPAEIKELTDLSRQIIHRYLKELLLDGEIVKIGKSPKVFYQINEAPIPYDDFQLNLKINFF